MVSIIIKILVYIYFIYCSYCAGRYITKYFLRREKKKKLSNAAKRKLKAKYFEKCEEVVKAAGSHTWGKTSLGEMQNLAIKMCDAGMGDIAQQELENVKKLYKELGCTKSNENG